MKITLIIPVIGCCACISGCKKNYPAYPDGKTMLYHIEGNDTISRVVIPNSFTPEFDGINDGFYLQNNSLDPSNVFLMEIYNSNGEKIFESNSIVYTSGWYGECKGTMCPNGTYNYHLKVTDTTGYLFDHTGLIHLIR